MEQQETGDDNLLNLEADVRRIFVEELDDLGPWGICPRCGRTSIVQPKHRSFVRCLDCFYVWIPKRR